ncbi:hypothetical protein OG738_33745 [Amycolatopsis sp. NBC_01488]|uniref:hypothetical protein n=1 Tax=Amycolatopsis sp. NBC_01488 TaxID=2903563 RepID=UPI002E2A15BB|nr:hypothetical protein [Amycolatopsis sp. NBC_01488]
MSVKPAVLTCMDARISVRRHLLGTRDIGLIHHRDCGLRTFTESARMPHADVARGYVPDEVP